MFLRLFCVLVGFTLPVAAAAQNQNQEIIDDRRGLIYAGDIDRVETYARDAYALY